MLNPVVCDMYVGNVGTWRYLEWQMNVRQALSSEKWFLSPRQRSNPRPSDDRWDALTIELPRLRWRAKVQVRHMCDLSSSHDMLIMLLMRYIFLEMGINISWMPFRSHICRTCTLACHLSVGSSMVSVSLVIRRLWVRSPSGAQKWFFSSKSSTIIKTRLSRSSLFFPPSIVRLRESLVIVK